MRETRFTSVVLYVLVGALLAARPAYAQQGPSDEADEGGVSDTEDAAEPSIDSAVQEVPGEVEPREEGAIEEGTRDPGVEESADPAAPQGKVAGPEGGTTLVASSSPGPVGKPEAAVDRAATAEQAPAPAATEPLPWRNSLFIWDHSVTTYTLDRGSLVSGGDAMIADSGLTANPTYVQTFSFRPRWHFTDTLSLRLRQDIFLELTDTDVYTRNREPILADTVLDLMDTQVVAPAGIAIGLGGRLVAPTSIASRANELYVGTGALFNAVKGFDVLDGLALIGSASYTYFWNGTNVPQTEERYPCATATLNLEAGSTCSQASGATNVEHQIVAGLVVNLTPVAGLDVTLIGQGIWQRGRGLATAYVPVDSSGEFVEIGDNSETHWRNLTLVALSVSYQLIDWLNVSLGIGSLTSQLDSNGSRRNPFFNPDTTVSLTGTASLSALYSAMTGEGLANASNPNTLR